MPVRKVSNRGGNIIGKFPSIKMGKMIAFESLLERDLIYLLDYEEDVEWFEEQPLTIEYLYEAKLLHYTPDFHLIEKGRDILIECKPEKFVARRENRRKADVARRWCLQHDWEYRIVTELHIRSGFRLQNVKILTRYARADVSLAMRESIYTHINHCPGQTSIDDIVKNVSRGNAAITAASILHMTFYHELWVPLNDVVLSGETQVSLPLQMRKEAKV